MKIIGIYGLSGSGKSTLSRHINQFALAKHDSSCIIELDCILDDIKKTLFSKQIKHIPYDENTHICLKNNPISKTKNKVFIKTFFALRNVLVNIVLKKELYSLKKQGIRLVIIEGANLNNLNVIQNIIIVIH